MKTDYFKYIGHGIIVGMLFTIIHILSQILGTLTAITHNL